MRVFLLAFAFAVSAVGLAQVEPAAADYLERALEAHGGEALQQLTTYQDEGVLINYDPAGAVFSEVPYRTVIDLAGPSLRMEMLAEGMVVVLQQVTPEGGFAYMVPNGEVPLTEEQVEELRMSVDAGFFGLRHGAAGAESARYLGEQTWDETSGHAVEVVRNGNAITYLLGADGRLLADRYSTAQLGETTNFYTELREVDGVLVPVAYESHALGMKVLGSRAHEVALGEPLPEDAFSLAGYLAASEAAREVSPEALAWLQANARPLDGVDAGAPTADLRALGELVNDARVVALGEQTHGTSEFFRMKHRVLEYLVREEGFTLFAIEANMPEAERVNRYVLTGAGDPAELLAGLYFWTWNTREVLDMIEWMREYNETAEVPVQFTGFDMQFPDVAAQNVVAFLEERDSELLEAYRADLERAVETSSLTGPADVAAPDRELRDRIEELVERMSERGAALAEAAGEQATAWAIQDARVVAQALGVPEGGIAWRDAAMAANVEWLLERNPGAKMVIWAHNGHVSKADGWMGAHLAEALGDDYLAIAFSFEEGEYTAVDPQAGAVQANTAGPAPQGSVDALLAQAGPDRFLLDLGAAAGSPAAPWFVEPRPFRSIGAVALPDGGSFPPTVVSADFDAVIFIRESTASQLLN